MLDRVMTLSKEDTLKVLAGVSLMSKEEIAARNRLLENLEKNVTVKDSENGRRMIIKGLDPSIFQDENDNLDQVVRSVLNRKDEKSIYDSIKMDIGEMGSLIGRAEYTSLIENEDRKEYSAVDTYSYMHTSIDISLSYRENYAA